MLVVPRPITMSDTPAWDFVWSRDSSLPTWYSNIQVFVCLYYSIHWASALPVKFYLPHTFFFSVTHNKSLKSEHKRLELLKESGGEILFIQFIQVDGLCMVTQGFKPLTIVSKSFIMVVCQSSKYVYNMRTCSILLCADPKPK